MRHEFISWEIPIGKSRRTVNDVIDKNKPICHIARYIREAEAVGLDIEVVNVLAAENNLQTV